MIKFNPTSEDYKEMENFLKNQDNDATKATNKKQKIEQCVISKNKPRAYIRRHAIRILALRVWLAKCYSRIQQ